MITGPKYPQNPGYSGKAAGGDDARRQGSRLRALPQRPCRFKRQQEAHPHNGLLACRRLLGDGMVVQRDVRIPVWGWASPGSSVRVVLGPDPGSPRGR